MRSAVDRSALPHAFASHLTSGHGRYVFKESGDVYEGSFIKGVIDGPGKYTTKASGQTVQGEFFAGRLRACDSTSTRMSFVDSPFTSKVEYEAYLKLSEAEAIERVALARAMVSVASR